MTEMSQTEILREDITNYKEIIQKRKGQKEKLSSMLDGLKKDIEKTCTELQEFKKAQEIIQIVAKLTQDQIKIHIEDIVNLALESIPFEVSYKFGLDFVVKRNKTECELYFIKDENRLNPIESSGGGVVDIASFGLRIALWSLKLGDKNNTIILDEPFRFLSRDLRPFASEMVKKISEKLNIQFLVVSHDIEFINMADKTFEVKIKNGRSVVNEIM